MLVEISLYLTTEDWPRIVGESTVTISDFLEPSQLPKTPVFTPPCSMSVSGCEPAPIDIGSDYSWITSLSSVVNNFTVCLEVSYSYRLCCWSDMLTFHCG